MPLPGEGVLCRSAVDVPMDDVLVPHDAIVFTFTKYKKKTNFLYRVNSKRVNVQTQELGFLLSQ